MLSNALLCHGTWLSFLIQPVVASLTRYPITELGICSVMLWHEAVAELCLEFTQLLKSCAPISFACLALALAISSLVLALAIVSNLLRTRPLFGLFLVTLAHGEC